MKEETYKKVFIKSPADLPEDVLLHVGNRHGFEEIIYIENGKTKKPFRYDSDDTSTLKIENIDWYLKEVEPVTDEDIEKWARNEIPFSGNDYNYEVGKRVGITIGAKAHRDGLIK
ncbi:MAG TPA: hypothetical protein VMV77_04625 [Bacteroidales bacterium]|nr:hypothetical protein [Bacteroidales bacterium]